ncbi:porin, partial [uncultured Agitococcus sp.]|uniref:porin n=1 Tax=uncultured Agitococcus sp. TaxID=1506599 RepID=UPI002611310F
GNIDSPLKNAEDDIDVFNDMARLDMGKFIYGQNRLENSINYVSPKFLDVFGVNLTLQPGEKNADDQKSLCLVPATPKKAAYNPCENHIADAISTALSYEDDNLYLSFAMDKEVMNMDAMRFNARYKMGDATISAMYQMAEPSNLGAGQTDEETAMVFSGSYKMDAVTVRGEVLVANHDMGGGTEDDTTLIGVGVDYNFTQATKAFANLASSNMESTPAAGAKSTDSDATYIGFGMETRF